MLFTIKTFPIFMLKLTYLKATVSEVVVKADSLKS